MSDVVRLSTPTYGRHTTPSVGVDISMAQSTTQHFMDPVTGVHTNSIEGSWTHAKKKLKNHGTSDDLCFVLGRILVAKEIPKGGSISTPNKPVDSFILSVALHV